MQTILDLIGSYFIGAFVIVALVGLIFYYTLAAEHAQLSEMTQRNIVDAGSVIEYDFNKIGYRVESGNKVTSANDSTITFKADLNNDGHVDSISYKLITLTGKKYLRRYASNIANSTWDLPCKNLFITLRDNTGSITNVITNVKSIELGIQLEQNSNNTLTGSFWKRKFFPRNL